MSHEQSPSQNNNFFCRKKPVITPIVEGLTVLATPNIKINNRKNLNATIKSSQGKSLIFVLNHLNNLDASSFERALKKAGHP